MGSLNPGRSRAARRSIRMIAASRLRSRIIPSITAIFEGTIPQGDSERPLEEAISSLSAKAAA